MTGGYPDDWDRRRKRVYKRNNWTCQTCGREGRRKGSAELHAHHIRPKSEGGGHHLENLITLCDRCHAEYHDDPRLLTDETNRRGIMGRLLLGDHTQKRESKQRRKKRKEGVRELKILARKREKRIQRERQSPLKSHAKVFLLIGWWTAGIGNVIYELWRRGQKHQTADSLKRGQGLLEELNERRPRLGKSDEKKGFWQQRVDKGRNEKYGGCPNCGKNSLIVSWVQLDDGSKAKAIECSECSTKYDESEDGLSKVQSVEELDSGGSAVIQELFG